MTNPQFLSIMTQDTPYITKHNDCSIDIQLNTKKLIYQYNNTPPDVTILPGVHIVGGSIIGDGSVVTKDIPSGVIVAGNPCRVLREITDADRINMEEEIKQI